MKTIVVTSPHAIGNPTFHYRDVVALKAARMLAQMLQSRQNVRVIALEGNVPRNECDLNRAGHCDPTDFKKQYLDALATATFVIDVHSFPPETRWSQREQVDVAFLYESAFSSIATSLAVRVSGTSIGRAIAIPGQPATNFIIYRATLANVPNVLLELNESLSDSAMNHVLEIIVSYILADSLFLKSAKIIWY